MMLNSVCLCVQKVKTESISVKIPSVIIAGFEEIAVEYT